jgi:anaerobic ribonucleoside-triphosphate reductase activating protein
MRKNSTPKINVASILPVSTVNGPSKRSVIWVQGCCFRCRGCFNEELQPFIQRRELTAGEVLAGIPFDRVEGITISGGEPFCQAEALSVLSAEVKSLGFSIMVYTGFTYDTLIASGDPFISRFLSDIDILVDGPYIEEIPARSKWAGSGNQNIIFLSGRYKDPEVERPDKSRFEEIHIDLNGMLTHTGFIEKTGDKNP